MIPYTSNDSLGRHDLLDDVHDYGPLLPQNSSPPAHAAARSTNASSSCGWSGAALSSSSLDAWAFAICPFKRRDLLPHRRDILLQLFDREQPFCIRPSVPVFLPLELADLFLHDADIDLRAFARSSVGQMPTLCTCSEHQLLRCHQFCHFVPYKRIGNPCIYRPVCACWGQRITSTRLEQQ